MYINKRQLLGFFVCAVILAILAITGEMDAKDQAQQQAYYCQMVAHGDWPDFKHRYQFDCVQSHDDVASRR